MVGKDGVKEPAFKTGGLAHHVFIKAMCKNFQHITITKTFNTNQYPPFISKQINKKHIPLHPETKQINYQ